MILADILISYTFRFHEIARSLDSVLVASSLAPIENASSLAPIENTQSDGENFPALTLKQSVTLLENLRSCWREDVFVLSCSDKFLRLSLQLLSRLV